MRLQNSSAVARRSSDGASERIIASSARERQHLWSSRQGYWLIVSSVVDLTIIALLASNDVLMTALPTIIVGGVFGMAIIFALALDGVEFALFYHLAIA